MTRHSRIAFACVEIVYLGCSILVNESRAAISYSVSGSTYTQTFDSLPKAPENATVGNTPAGWIDDSTTPATNQFSIEGWYLRHNLSVADGGANGFQRLRGASTGNSSTGAFYSYGIIDSGNRALGSQGSNTVATRPSATPPGYMYMAARLVNNTPDTLNGFNLTYDGEQWRVGGSVGSPAGTGNETLSFAYSLTATTADWFSSTGFTAVPSLNFTAPQTGAARAIDGTSRPSGMNGGLVPNITGTVTGINWAPGQELWLRWYDPQPGNAANNDGLAIDNIRFIAPAPTSTQAVNVTLGAALAGKTPEIFGYNSGHFMPGSNTADWWRYSGVNGARVFSTPTVVEASDDLAPWGDNVNSQPTFAARRDALRADPLSTTNINWPYIEGRYANNPTSGSNIINLKYAFGQMHNLHIDPLVQIDYRDSSFPWDPAGTAAGWADRWEEWQHFYAQAFYLAKNFDVHRFQMYNEPNLDDIPPDEWLERLRFASDAVQSAVADVNRLYGKSLDAQMQGPVTARDPNTYYPTWGQPVMDTLHTNELGVTDPNFRVIDTYAYQQYNQTADEFGNELANIKTTVNGAAGGSPMRFAVTEFNVHTAAYFDTTTDTLDTPAQFSRFGSILAQLANNKPDELYVFKFSQGPGDITVKKNGTHFVDNDSAPYNIGGVTKGGEVVRLAAKAFAGAKDLFVVPTTSGTGAADLRVAASHDPQWNKYYFFSANEGTQARSLNIDLSSWGIAPGARAIVEEVSADSQGEVRHILTVPQNGILNLTQTAQSVFLISIPKTAPTSVVTLSATDDAMVQSGTNAGVNFGANADLLAKNDAVDPAARSVTFLKFNTGSIVNSEVQQAVLQLWGENAGSASQVIAHVYGLTNDNWNESSITWNNAPNLASNLGTAIDDISENFIEDIGNSAHIVGELTGIAAARQLSFDVTDFVRDHPDQQVTFLIAREVRFDGENVDDALTALRLASKEGGFDFRPQLFITLASIPEPNTMILTAFALAFLMHVRQRRGSIKLQRKR
jgi:hypothetical protein